MDRTRLIGSAVALLTALTSGVVACSDGKSPRIGPCTLGELADCGSACSDTSPCNAGLYCQSGTCAALCTVATSARDCGAAGLCTSDGKCLDDVSMGGDGGARSDGGGTPGLDDSGAIIGSDGAVCADITVDTSMVTPNVVIIVDQSSSMTEALGDTTRWEGLRQALLANDGILDEFESTVRFGFALYSARAGAATCPLVTEVAVAAGNVDEIRSIYQAAEPIADTPTGDAIDVVLESVRAAGLLEIDYRDPTIFILATDGEPDRCEQLNPQNGQEEAIAAVTHAYEAGVRTYVIAVANEADISEQHVNALASAGVGMDGAPSYRVTDDTGIRNALRELINREVTCQLSLRGVIDDPENCGGGTVTLGGNVLECNGANGYTVTAPSTLTVQGEACETLKSGLTLKATFPCGSVILK